MNDMKMSRDLQEPAGPQSARSAGPEIDERVMVSPDRRAKGLEPIGGFAARILERIVANAQDAS